ncbi:MAG: hypothetical protein ABUT20_15260 [Bacteroidota bacterium]
MKRLLYCWSVVLILSLGMVIIAQLLFREYRFNHLPNLGQIGKIEFIFTSFLLPIYLSIVFWLFNSWFVSSINFRVYLFFVIICILISSYLDFTNWWDTEGKVISIHDAESRDITEIALSFQFLIAIVVGIASLYTARDTNKSSYTKTP